MLNSLQQLAIARYRRKQLFDEASPVKVGKYHAYLDAETRDSITNCAQIVFKAPLTSS